MCDESFRESFNVFGRMSCRGYQRYEECGLDHLHQQITRVGIININKATYSNRLHATCDSKSELASMENINFTIYTNVAFNVPCNYISEIPIQSQNCMWAFILTDFLNIEFIYSVKVESGKNALIEIRVHILLSISGRSYSYSAGDWFEAFTILRILKPKYIMSVVGALVHIFRIFFCNFPPKSPALLTDKMQRCIRLSQHVREIEFTVFSR